MVQNTPNNQTLVYSSEALRAIDKDAVEQYQIPSVVLMENAGKGASSIILDSIDTSLHSNIVVVCGSGNNGGDGYVVARHLANNGCGVSILQASKPTYHDAVTNANMCQEMDIKIEGWPCNLLSQATLLVDALLGTGLSRAVVGANLNIIQGMNACKAPCIALDIPSGLDCDSGKVLGCCIQASMTISFVGMKKGFLNDSAESYLGEIVISDIGTPIALLEKNAFGLT